MKKKSLLFLSICAWALQSHLVHANTLAETTSTVSQGNEISESSATTKATSSVTAESTVQAEQTVETDAVTNNQVVVASSSSAETGSQTSLVTPASTAQNKSASTSSADTVATATSKTEIAFAPSPSQTETSSVATEPTGTVSVVNVDAQKGSFDVKVTNVSSPKEISNVYVPTWTETSGQDDIIWYEAKRQLDGSYLLNVNKAQHKYGSGKYHSHVYYRTTDGSLTGIGATSVVLPEVKTSGTITTTVSAQTGSYQVRVSDISAPRGLDKVLVPTWTAASGQDDIIWHEAQRQSDGSYIAKISKVQHKNESGQYVSHVYYRGIDGSLTGVGATSAVLPEVKANGIVKATNISPETGSYEVAISDIIAPKGLDKVFVPTWSENKGQDDIIWHEAQRQSNGTYLAKITKSQHKNDSGKYISHVYYRGLDGSLTAIGATDAVLPEVKASGTVTAKNINTQTGSYEVQVSNIVAPRGLVKVLVPTWTETNGQDDIIWHEAQRQSDGSYLAKINKADHKYGSGKYISHVYYRGTDGSLTGVGATSAVLTEVKASGTVTTKNINLQTGSYEVQVSNIVAPRGLEKVFVPTWTDSKGQDDIVWHEAQRQSDGSYLAKISKANHKYGSGTYISHVYYRGTDGNLTAIGATTVELPEVKATGTLTVKNINNQAGSFEVQVSNITAPRGVDKVFVPTWTDSKGQDDIVWHEAQRQTDGTYIAKIYKYQHRFETGVYHTHLYYRGLDGSMTGVAATTAELVPVDPGTITRSYTVYLDPGHGGIDSGASYGGVHEKNLALSVANKLKDTLLQRGINVLMTRNADYNVDFLTERSRMANESNADLFVSIHFNASGAGVTTAKGIETYWYQPYDAYPSKINQAKHADPVRLAESEILANKVQSNLISETGAVDRGILRRTFAVLRETAIPAILVELGYMDNPSELQTIKQSSYHDKLAAGLANGIMDWYGTVEGKQLPR
ncbi:GBS Bsp-like repeat-containing protein [Streptococcus suis]|uniref:GBS Bsp-like repeat-containing protein n=1 Tax=Streptococcus suis TaxID=1307 RepID=UPI002117D859|nr:GBS Bsp-like repeat-containing protein [Streptococcus suis]